jgi:hypothetical protein
MDRTVTVSAANSPPLLLLHTDTNFHWKNATALPHFKREKNATIFFQWKWCIVHRFKHDKML